MINYLLTFLKLAKALIEYDLNEDGGVEMGLATALEELQCRSFSKMSRFSKFCKFLSETGEGRDIKLSINLVLFFLFFPFDSQSFQRLKTGCFFHCCPARFCGLLRGGPRLGHSHRRTQRQIFRRNELLVFTEKSSRKLRICRPIDKRWLVVII